MRVTVRTSHRLPEKWAAAFYGSINRNISCLCNIALRKSIFSAIRNIKILLLRIFCSWAFDAFEGIDYSLFFLKSIGRTWYLLGIFHFVQCIFMVKKLNQRFAN